MIETSRELNFISLQNFLQGQGRRSVERSFKRLFALFVGIQDATRGIQDKSALFQFVQHFQESFGGIAGLDVA